MKKFTKMLPLILSAVLLISLLAACGSSGKTIEDIKSSGKLVIATSPDFPPFEYLEDGQVAGIEVDILSAVAEKLGVELQIEQMDFDSVIPGVQAGKFDVGVSGITANEKRKKNVDFSHAYFLASQAIVVNQDSPVSSKEDLAGKKISVQTGTTAEDYCMQSGYEVLAFTANNDAAAALTAGKVDAWVVDNEVALVLAEQNHLKVLEEAMTSEAYAFAFPKMSDSFVKAFNEVLDTMLEDGTVEEIFKKYGTVYVSPLA